MSFVRYRKVAADKCQGGPLVDKYRAVKVKCPVIKPGGLGILTDESVIPVNKNVMFTLTQEQVTDFFISFCILGHLRRSCGSVVKVTDSQPGCAALVQFWSSSVQL